jgi:hypothetical protein
MPDVVMLKHLQHVRAAEAGSLGNPEVALCSNPSLQVKATGSLQPFHPALEGRADGSLWAPDRTALDSGRARVD